MSRTRSRTLAVAGTVLLAALVVAPPAAADVKPHSTAPAPTATVPGGFPTWDALYAYQHRLNSAATSILAAGGGGNAGIVAAPGNRELRVYWAGKVPAAIRTLAARQDVPVRILSARYPQADLVAAAQRVATDPQVTQASPRADGTGVDVTVLPTLRLTGQADLTATAGVPVALSTGQRLQSFIGRQADTPAFWGGSRYTTTGACTNGFALKVFPGPAQTFMASAAHCGNPGNPVSIPGLGVQGTFFAENTCRDNAIINYGGGTSGRIYTGIWNAATSVGVNGAAGGATSDFIGNLINTGGATSGEHGGVAVVAVNVFAAIGGIPCPTVGPLTRAVSVVPLQCVAAPGDSGGPVYSPFAGGILARGTITGGAINTTCNPAWPAGGPAAGGDNVLYAPLLRPPGDPQIGSLQLFGTWVQP